ncbi:MAG: hypothetical protein ACO1N9_10025 [Flavobacterium sp.]
MKKDLNVLAIDDHAVVLQGYFSIFKHLENSFSINFKKAWDCKSGHDVIVGNVDTPFDVAVLDYSIPSHPELGLYSGEDMAGLIRKHMPGCKIIMMTMHREFEILGRILQNIQPEGFINKSDCATEELIEAFATVVNDGSFYSPTVKNYMVRLEKDIVLDDADLRLLHKLAKGIKGRSLAKCLMLSDAVIEKRRQKLKKLFEIDGDDDALVAEAKKLGYI